MTTRHPSQSRVAWGGYDDDYLVVWEYWNSGPPASWKILVSYVWDTNQTGDQLETAPSFLIAPGSYDYYQTLPAAAYNPGTRNYLVVFQYDYGGDGSDSDIMALRLTPGGGSVGGVSSIAATADQEYWPAVAYSGGTQSIPGGMGADQFLVTFAVPYGGNQAAGIYGQAVWGPYVTSGSQREGDRVRIGTTFNGDQDHDVIGSINTGRYMTRVGRLACWRRKCCAGSTGRTLRGVPAGAAL